MAGKKPKEEAISEALRKQAQGFTVVEVKETVEADDSGKSKTKKERTRKFVPPDLDALKLWMEMGGQEEGGGVTVVSSVPRPPEEEDESGATL